MSIEHIPVLLNHGDLNPIGFGSIADGTLTIVVKTEPLVEVLEHLVRAENIKEIYLGFTFPAALQGAVKLE